jgi:hypothetical protein
MDSGAATKEEPKRFGKNAYVLFDFIVTDEIYAVTTPQDILRKFKGSTPSLRVYLHTNHFRINDSQESFNYASPMKELLTHIREKTVPHNMLSEFYEAGMPFYDSKRN